ncbi:hypothetical protein [Azospirillum palustre]
MRRNLAFLPLAGGVSAMVQAFGGHRVRFDLEDGSGGGLAGGGGADAGGAPAETGTPAAPAEPLSIRDSLAAALKQQDGGESAGTGTPATDGAETGNKAADGRVRNPDGTFAPKAGDAAPAQADASQQAKPATQPAATAPEALTPAERETFAKLPAEAQALVSQHVQQVANERRFYGEMAPSMQAVQHFAQRFQAHPAQVIGAWAQVQDNLSRDPVAAIKGLAQQFGVDLTKIGAPTQPQEDVYVDPQVAALQQQLANVQQFVQTEQQRQQEALRRQEEETQRSVQTTLQDFSGAKDEAGQPKHPHFDAVRQHMAALLNAGAAKDLADAYEQAVWARPELRQQMLAAQQQQETQRQQDRQRQQAARARQASGSIAGAPGGVAPPGAPSDTSIRGLLSQAAGLA